MDDETPETDAERAARHALNRPLEDQFRRIDVQHRAANAALDAANAAAAAMTAATEQMSTTGWRLLALADARVAYHAKVYRITAISSVIMVSGAAGWGAVSNTSTSLLLIALTAALALFAIAGSVWWVNKATRRVYYEHIAGIEEIVGRRPKGWSADSTTVEEYLHDGSPR